MVNVTLAAVLWGTTGVAVVFLSELTPLTPTAIGFYRLLVAAAALLAFAVAAGRVGPLIRITRRAPARVVLTGVGLGGYQALYFVAVAEAGVGVATVVSLGIAPVVTTAWETVRARVRPSARTVVVIAAALLGLALIGAATPSGTASRPLAGLLAAIGSGVVYAVSTLISRDLSQRTDALTLTTTTSIAGALALLPIAAVQGLTFPLRADVVGLLGYTGVVTTAVAYALFYAGLRTVSGSVAAVLTLLEPLTAALLAVAILGEPLPALTVAGGVLLLAAVAALYLRPRAYRAVSVLS
ncbi:MAG TPA: DMT family transporter [Actinoplanes sp.]|nr:DMT family transporter [Actinoplanes sp.]